MLRLFTDYIAESFKSRNSPQQDPSLHLGMKIVLALNLVLAALYFAYAVTGVWKPENMTSEEFLPRAIRASIWIIVSSVGAYVYNRAKCAGVPPTMPLSVPLTRGTPPAGQEPRHGSRSAHG